MEDDKTLCDCCDLVSDNWLCKNCWVSECHPQGIPGPCKKEAE